MCKCVTCGYLRLCPVCAGMLSEMVGGGLRWGLFAGRAAAARFSINFKGRRGLMKTEGGVMAEVNILRNFLRQICLWGRQPFQLHSCFIFPSLLAECCRKSISKAWSYLPPRWPAAASGWWGWCGVPPQWLKLFSWHISLLHKQWGWMQEPVDLGCSQRQQQRAFQDTCAQNRAQLSCLTSCPCWQWRILTTLRYSWKERLWRIKKCSLCHSWKCAYSALHISKYCAGSADKGTKQIQSAIRI